MRAWPFLETGGQAGTVGGGCVATGLLLSLSEWAPSSAQWLCSQSAFTGLSEDSCTDVVLRGLVCSKRSHVCFCGLYA